MKYRTYVAGTIFTLLAVAGADFAAQVPSQNGDAAPQAQGTQTQPSQAQPQKQPDRGGNTQVPAAGASAGPGQGTPGTVVGRPGGRRFQPPSYPERQVDPAKAERGKVLFGVSCSFCHGSDARGGEGGPNLIRSQLVLNDKDGETIAPTIQNGRPDRGMPKFDFSMAQISDIAAFLHSFKVGGYDISRKEPPSIIVGDAATGKTTFQAMCGSCHSITGDLRGFAAKVKDPRTLQQTWIMPVGGGGFMSTEDVPVHVPPTTVTVTLPSGKEFEGKLNRIDDFTISLTDSEGYEHTFDRKGNEPKVVIHDPLAPHRELLAKYTDKEIHDITAYLETTK